MKWIMALAVAIAVLTPVSSWADPHVTPDSWSPVLHVRAEDQTPSSSSSEANRPVASTPPRIPTDVTCLEDAEGVDQCYPRAFDDDPEDPDLTEGDILRAVREIGLPSLKVQIQPGEETLVNVETIFYTRPQPFERSVTLLGFDIDLVAEPVRYTWVHDDGTVSTTSQPGKPYPAMDVTHRYREPADDVHPRVDVTYQVRYRVDGGAWQTIGQTLQASGPAAELDVREAAPVLTRP